MTLRALFVLVVLGLTQVGCAGINRRLKNLLGGQEQEKPASTLTKFSDNGDVIPPVRRQYRRTTKESLSDQAALDAHSGSLWAMEGQGAYLFAPNIVRLVGDPLAVQIEGDPKDQLNAKVGVIKKLLAKIEERDRAAEGRGPASTSEAEAGAGGDQAKSADAKSDDKKADGAAEGNDLGIKNVPTRIVERTVEGNYRVKGQQPFLVKNREYKVIVTGVVKAEDFNDEGIPASKLIDPKFDIVSAGRHEGAEL